MNDIEKAFRGLGRTKKVEFISENTTVQRNFPIESTDHHRSFSSDVLV